MVISVQTLLHSSLPPGGVVEYTSIAPPNPINGQLWFNTGDNVLYVWDNGTWTIVSTSLTQTNLAGGTENQILVKKSSTDYDFQWEDMIINLPETTYTKLLDQVSSTLLYLGEAAPESVEGDPVWRIQRITFDSAGNVDEVRYAVGGNFDQIWDNRTSLIYI